jgi:isopropylmalate/homocitrate/citramalate synthase
MSDIEDSLTEDSASKDSGLPRCVDIREVGPRDGLQLEAGVDVGVHFHNTRGTGIASAWAAVQAGVTRLDSSVGGLGGCPFAPGATGNIATDELVYLLTDSEIETGVDLGAALDAARLVETMVGHSADSSLLRAGGRSVPRRASDAPASISGLAGG